MAASCSARPGRSGLCKTCGPCCCPVAERLPARQLAAGASAHALRAARRGSCATTAFESCASGVFEPALSPRQCLASVGIHLSHSAPLSLGPNKPALEPFQLCWQTAFCRHNDLSSCICNQLGVSVSIPPVQELRHRTQPGRASSGSVVCQAMGVPRSSMASLRQQRMARPKRSCISLA